jgi:hypothetical protein
VKELSLNTSRELTGKLDISDFERTIANYGTADFPHNNRWESIVRQSRTMLRSPERLRGRKGKENSEDNDENSDVDSPVSEKNKEFDYLIRTLKREGVRDEVSHNSPTRDQKKLKHQQMGKEKLLVQNDEAVSELAAGLEKLRDEVETVRKALSSLQAKEKHSEPEKQVVPRNTGGIRNKEHIDSIDWRIALGEISVNFRRDLADKVNREEMFAFFRNENDILMQQCHVLQRDCEMFAKKDQIGQFEQDLISLKSKIAGELIGARFLWTTGTTNADSWIPWDTQIVNATPKNVLWQKNSQVLTVRVPGLYKITLSVFTLDSAVVQLYLNEEPLLLYQPDNSLQSNDSNKQTGTLNSSRATRTANNDRYQLKRLRHSAGEVTCITIDEYVSLPLEAKLSARYQSSHAAQAFLAIKKL